MQSEPSPHWRNQSRVAVAALSATVLFGISLTACAAPPVTSLPATSGAASPSGSPSASEPSYDSSFDTPPPSDTATDAPDGQQPIDHSTATLPPPTGLSISASMVLNAPEKVVQVVATIDNIVSGDGQCKITVGSYSTSVPIVPNAQDSSCQINQIPVGQIKRGDSFTVTASSGGLTGTTSGKVQ